MMIKCTFAHKNCNKQMEERVTDRGHCFSFNGPSQNPPVVSGMPGNKEGLTMFLYLDQTNYIPAVNMGAGLQVAIHHRDVEPNLAEKSFLVSPGTVTYVQMTKAKYTYLPRPFKAFGEHYCTKTNVLDFRNPLEHYPKYSFYACTRECRSRYIYRTCNCRLITDIGNETICTIAQEYQCALRTKDLFNSKPELLAACNCPQPCEEEVFQKQMSFAQFPSEKFREALTVLPLPTHNITTNYLELRFYYDSFVVHTVEQVPKVDITSIFGNIGGFLGIFLGASLMTLMEVLEVVVITGYVLLRRLMGQIIWKQDSTRLAHNKITDVGTIKTSIQKFVKN